MARTWKTLLVALTVVTQLSGPAQTLQAQEAVPSDGGPSYARTLRGAAFGGVIGAGVTAGGVYLLGSIGGDDGGFFEPNVILTAVAGAAGYVYGTAIGAGRGASGTGHEVAGSSLIGRSIQFGLLGVGAGMAAGMEGEDAGGQLLALGILVGHMAAVSWTAHRRAREAWAASSTDVAVSIAPRGMPDGDLGLGVGIRITR